MPSYRIRYLASDIELPGGTFTIGRSARCELTLEDPLVSRRHLRLDISADGVRAKDLESRNGVTVNDEALTEQRALSHLDRIQVGSQELILLRSESAEKRSSPTLSGRIADLRADAEKTDGDDDELQNVDTDVPRSATHPNPTIPPAPRMPRESIPSPPESNDIASTMEGDSILDRIATKALAMGRKDEAERMLTGTLRGVLDKARAQGELDSNKRAAAVRYAMQLAQLTGHIEWLDYVFELHDAIDTLVDANTLEQLHRLVRQLRHPGSRILSDYVSHMRDRAASLSPGDRFLLKRLEGLQRVVNA